MREEGHDVHTFLGSPYDLVASLKRLANSKQLNANYLMEVHVGWCPPGTSNPTGLPMVDRSVRFRLTSAKAGSSTNDMARKQKPKPLRAAKEVKRRARLLVGAPPPVRREES